MSRFLRILFPAVYALGLFLAGAIPGCGSDSTKPPVTVDCESVADTTQPATVSYQNDIFPLFLPQAYNCNDSGCHGSPLVSSDFAVSEYQDLFRQGEEARRIGICSIKPGDPDASYLLWKIEGRSGIEGKRMPETGPVMTPADIQLVRTWIQEGARNN